MLLKVVILAVAAKGDLYLAHAAVLDLVKRQSKNPLTLKCTSCTPVMLSYFAPLFLFFIFEIQQERRRARGKAEKST